MLFDEETTNMCKLTILKYSRCNCNARDGNDGNGFIVTRSWHDRLLLDRDAVPFERCLQARCFALPINQANTQEFSRCTSVKVKTVCFQEEVCFRCLMDQRSKQRADKIRALLAEHKSFSTRYAATKQSAAKEAKSTRDMWQSIRESPRSDKIWKDEKLRFVGTIGNLRATHSGAVKEMLPDWEIRLENQIASRAKRVEGKVKMKGGEISREGKEQEDKRKRNRLACLQLRLEQANKRAVSPDSGEEAHGSPLPEYEEMEQELCFQEVPTQRLRIARPAKRSLNGFGPTLDEMVSAQIVQQSFREDNLSQTLPASLEMCSPEIIIAHPSVLLSTNRRVVRPHSMEPSNSINIDVPVQDVPDGTRACPAVESAFPPSFSTLSAEVSEFKPFKQPPPTEPQLMRAPTAPRAMREGIYGSLPRNMCRPLGNFATVQDYATIRGWRR